MEIERRRELRKVYTVSELNLSIASKLESDYSFIWLQGELSDLRSFASGHIYFSLKDKDSLISCVIFKNQAKNLSFTLSSGLKITGFGRVNLYSPRGTYNFIFEYLEVMGRGNLYLAYEKTKNKLQAEGLFDSDKKQKLPYLPQRLSIISSKSGVVIYDILKVLNRKFPNLDIEIAPVRVQGKEAEKDIIEAIESIERQNKSKLIILARGGGSFEDLQPFNSEKLARAIHSSKIPVITGIGHEADLTIADLAADYRASTPTAAAEIAVPDKAVLKEKIELLKLRLIDGFQRKLNLLREENKGLKIRLRESRKKADKDKARLTEAEARLKLNLKNYLKEKKDSFLLIKKGLHLKSIYQDIRLKEVSLNNLKKEMQANGDFILYKKKLRLEKLSDSLANLAPLSVLSRGYALARELDKKTILYSTENLRIKDKIEVKLASGSLICLIEDIINE